MNLYCLQLYNYDGTGDWLFTHENEKTQEEWMDDVNKAIREGVKECIVNARHEKNFLYNSNLVYAAFSTLRDKYNYTLIKPITYSIAEGGAVGFDDKETEWTKIIGKALYQKAADWNRELEQNF